MTGPMKHNHLLGVSALVAVLALAACGGQQPRASTSAAPATAPPTATPAPTPTATPAPTPVPTPTPVSVPDFQVVAYQGADAFGGQQGHFAAAFASGRPVVLLYFAGL